jgi:hypothetical protein
MRTMEEWQNLIQEKKESGLKQMDFCSSKGISLKTFSARKSRIKSSAKVRNKPKQAKFIRVHKVTSRASIDVNPPLNLRIKTKAGIEIEFPLSSLSSVISILNGVAR